MMITYFRSSLLTIPTKEPFVRQGQFWYFHLYDIWAVQLFHHNENHSILEFLIYHSLMSITSTKAFFISSVVSFLKTCQTMFVGFLRNSHIFLS